MEKNKVIITDQSAIAKAIKANLPYQVLEIHPQFIDLDDPGYNDEFVPSFQTVNPKAEKIVRMLSGEVVCAIPPRTPGSSNMLLYHAMHTLRNRPAVVLYAPLHSLEPSALVEAIENAQKPDPWYVTSLVARRLTERLIGKKVVPLLVPEKLSYNGWLSLYYLHIIAENNTPQWARRLLFGPCVASEIDGFGGVIRHSQKPDLFKLEFGVTERTVASNYPDPKLKLNQYLMQTSKPLIDSHNELEQLYFDGKCTWPFTYGGLEYGQQEFKTLLGTEGIVVGESGKAEKVIRLYEQPPYMFKSASYYPEGKAAVNEIPNGRFPVRMETRAVGGEGTVNSFLQSLTEQQVNVDLPSLLKPIMIEYVTQQGDQLAITAKGQMVVELTRSIGLTRRVLYTIMRILENVQTDESSYVHVMERISKILAGTKLVE